MKRGRVFRTLPICLSLAFVIGGAIMAEAKVPMGFRDINLGMNRSQVVDLLQKGPNHFSYDEIGDEIGEIVRGDQLFRYATYGFDKEATLVEIKLNIREIMGQDKVLELFNGQYGISLSPVQAVSESNVTIEVKENTVVMRMLSAKDTRSAHKP